MVLATSNNMHFIHSTATREEFFARLNTVKEIASSDDHNVLLNERLEITERWDLRWIFRKILTPVCFIFRDLFLDVRMNRVAESLKAFLHVNQHYFVTSDSLRAEIRDISNRIITPLKDKTHHYDRILDRVLAESYDRLGQLERAEAAAAQAEQQQTIQTLQQTVETLQTALQTEQAGRQQDVQNLQGRVQILQTALQTEQVERHTDVQFFRGRVGSLDTELRRERTGRQTDVQTLQATVRAQGRALESSQREFQALGNRVQTLDRELRQERTGRQEEVKALQGRVQTLETALEEEQAGRRQDAETFEETVEILRTTLQAERQQAIDAVARPLQERVGILEEALETGPAGQQGVLLSMQQKVELKSFKKAAKREHANMLQLACPDVFRPFQNRGQFSSLHMSWTLCKSFTSALNTANRGLMSRKILNFDDSQDIGDVSAIEELPEDSISPDFEHLLNEMTSLLEKMHPFVESEKIERADEDSPSVSGASDNELKSRFEELNAKLIQMKDQVQDITTFEQSVGEMLTIIEGMVKLAQDQKGNVSEESEVSDDSNITSLVDGLVKIFRVYLKISEGVEYVKRTAVNSNLSETYQDRTSTEQEVLSQLSGLSTTDGGGGRGNSFLGEILSAASSRLQEVCDRRLNQSYETPLRPNQIMGTASGTGNIFGTPARVPLIPRTPKILTGTSLRPQSSLREITS